MSKYGFKKAISNKYFGQNLIKILSLGEEILLERLNKYIGGLDFFSRFKEIILILEITGIYCNFQKNS